MASTTDATAPVTEIPILDENAQAALAAENAAAAEAQTKEKLAKANEKKEAGDAAFKAGDLREALMNYHQALLYATGVDNKKGMPSNPDSTVPVASDVEPKPRSEPDILLEKIYSNMSMCHIKNSNWKRALETAEKALAKNPSNSKAAFRKGKAQGEIGYFEKAEKTLGELMADDSVSEREKTDIKRELERLRALDKQREKTYTNKYKGFLNKSPASPTPADTEVKS